VCLHAGSKAGGAYGLPVRWMGMSVTRLRRSDTSAPGLRRVPRGRGFQYLTPDGSRPEAADLARIESLVIPPAWTDVWICAWPHGHLQVTGMDAAGRRQYIYHPAWRAKRDKEKYDHVLEVAARLPAARKAACTQLAASRLTRQRVLATAFILLDVGLFRIGGDRYAEENGSYGLMTLQREHVHCGKGGLVFEYPAKSGKERMQVVMADEAAAVIRALRRGRPAGQRLLAYRGGGAWHELGSDDLNSYLKELFGREVSAKDFRTWHATVLAAIGLAVSGHAASPTARKRAVSRTISEVADYLGNTPAVCRRSYVDPRLVDRYLDGETIDVRVDQLGADARPGWPATHGRVEAEVIGLLKD
jgi:DNA topoisomerase I